MLQKNEKCGTFAAPQNCATGKDVIVIASEFNKQYVDSMLSATEPILEKAGLNVRVYRVPGAYEIPCIIGKILTKTRPAAFLCLGVVMRGETTHAVNITEAVTATFSNTQCATAIPIINGVYMFENHEQAQKRCIDPEYNRGIELANTTIAMIQNMEQIEKDFPK